MDVQAYINSGILDKYCLGVLPELDSAAVEQACNTHPAIRQELAARQLAMEGYIQAAGVQPAPEMESLIWDTLDNVNTENRRDINDLSLLNRFSDYNNWLPMLQAFIPEQIPEDRIAIPLRQAGGITQVFFISRTGIDEEVHETERECFLILKGECECTIGGNAQRYGPGGFIDIPLHVTHDVKLISPYVIAVAQYMAV